MSTIIARKRHANAAVLQC